MITQLQDLSSKPFTRKSRSLLHIVGAPVGGSIDSVGTIVGATVLGLVVTFVGVKVIGSTRSWQLLHVNGHAFLVSFTSQ